MGMVAADQIVAEKRVALTNQMLLKNGESLIKESILMKIYSNHG